MGHTAKIGDEKSNLIFHINYFHFWPNFQVSIIVKCRTPIGTLRIMSLQRPQALLPPELPIAGMVRTKMTMSKIRGTKNLTKKMTVKAVKIQSKLYNGRKRKSWEIL